MNNRIKIISILCCFLLLVNFKTFAVNAEESNAISIIIDETSLEIGEEAVISMFLNENPHNITDAEVILRNPDEMPYFRTVMLERTGKNLLQGKIIVDNLMPSGNYDIQEINVYRYAEPYYAEKLVSDKYNNYFYQGVAYLPNNFLSISNTTGYIPSVNVDFFNSDTNSPNNYANPYLETDDKLIIRLETNENIFNFSDCYLEVGLKAHDGYNFNKMIKLDRVDGNVFEKEIAISRYFQDGRYTVNRISLKDEKSEVIINNSNENPYDSTVVPVSDNSIPDHSNFVPEIPYYYQKSDGYFVVSGTETDTKPPILQNVYLNATTISRNGIFKFEILANDELSGLLEGEFSLSGNTTEKIDLELTKSNTLSGEFKPSPFRRHNGRWSLNPLQLKDHAGNLSSFSFGGMGHFANIELFVEGFDHIGEIYGSNRYNTAIEISGYFPESEAVIIASGTDFPDALTAGPLAAMNEAPILLTKSDGLSEKILDEIQRRNTSRVILLGGTTAISENVESDLRKIGINNIERIYGKNRYYTSISVADEIISEKNSRDIIVDEIYLVSGSSFPDALSISSLASIEQKPILLTSHDKLHSEVKNMLEKKIIKKVTIIGGVAAVNDSIANEIEAMGILVERISGYDRFETSMKVMNEYFSKRRHAFIVNGFDFADALTAAPLAAIYNAPIVLVKTSQLPKVTAKYLSDIELSVVDFVTVIGGNNAISIETKEAISDIIRNK